MIRFLPLLLLGLCTSCIQLGGESQPIHYYLLEPIAETIDAGSSRPLYVELGPIEFPTYLDRPQIVSRDANDSIIIADFDRWAEPLPENLARTLQENLFKLLNNVRISSAPWAAAAERRFSVRLIINRLDGIIGQRTAVDIRWSLFDSISNREILRKHFIDRSAIGSSYQDLVTGLNRAVAKLCKDIAMALNEQAVKSK